MKQKVNLSSVHFAKDLHQNLMLITILTFGFVAGVEIDSDI